MDDIDFDAAPEQGGRYSRDPETGELSPAPEDGEPTSTEE